jgi:hypothetical protein
MVVLEGEWVTRQDVGTDGCYSFIQIRSPCVLGCAVAEMTTEEIYTHAEKCAEPLIEWAISSLTKIPEFTGVSTTVRLANGFHSPGTEVQRVLGWHFSPGRKVTSTGQQLIDNQSQDLSEGGQSGVEVQIHFTPTAFIALPTVFSKGHTVAQKLEDQGFQNLHIRSRNTGDKSSGGDGSEEWVQLAQLAVGGNICVSLGGETLWEQRYEAGKFGNPHVTLLSLHTRKANVANKAEEFQDLLALELRESEAVPILDIGTDAGALQLADEVFQFLQPCTTGSSPSPLPVRSISQGGVGGGEEGEALKAKKAKKAKKI